MSTKQTCIDEKCSAAAAKNKTQKSKKKLKIKEQGSFSLFNHVLGSLVSNVKFT